MKGKMPEEPCYPKLALHGGQLFSSMNDCISVFCGPEWVLTSRLRRSYGGEEGVRVWVGIWREGEGKIMFFMLKNIFIICRSRLVSLPR